MEAKKWLIANFQEPPFDQTLPPTWGNSGNPVPRNGKLRESLVNIIYIYIWIILKTNHELLGQHGLSGIFKSFRSRQSSIFTIFLEDFRDQSQTHGAKLRGVEVVWFPYKFCLQVSESGFKNKSDIKIHCLMYGKNLTLAESSKFNTMT